MIGVVSAGCGGPTTGGPSQVCVPSMTVSCPCATGASGTQTCNESGTGFLAACACGGASGCTPACQSGYVCQNRVCVRQSASGCTPSCASGSHCEGGACVPDAATCSLAPGASCSPGDPCCGDNARSIRGVCAGGGYFGSDYTCSALCGSDSECTSGCCYTLQNGQGACRRAGLGTEGAPCRSSACCASPLVCSNGSCAQPGYVRNLDPGQPCTDSRQCWGNTSHTSEGVCANLFNTGYYCRAFCTNGSNCTSGCCYRLDNGQGACGQTLLAPAGSACQASSCCAGSLICSSGVCR